MKMKTRKSISLLLVFMMIFTMIPYMSDWSKVHGADSVHFVQDTPEITNTNGNAAYGYEFQADETNSMDLQIERKYFSASESGIDFRIEIYNQSGQIIASEKASGGLLKLKIAQFPKADKYTLILYSDQNHMGYSIYHVDMNIKEAQQNTGKYESFTAKVGNYKEGSVYEYADYYVKLNVGKYQGTDALKQAIYRENLDTGIFYATDSEDIVWDDTVDMGATYRYYVVNKNLLDYASELPQKKKSKKISAAAKKELKAKANTAKVSIPAPTIQNVTDLKNKQKGVMRATLTWWYSANAEPGYVTGYELKVYNSKGKKVGKTVYATKGNIGTTVKIPYAGKSKVTVTPYYNYKDKTYYGKTKSIKVTSAKIKAPSTNVTKINNSKVKITTYRDPAAVGVQIQQKVGKKWKNVTTKGTAKTFKKTWTKNSAGKTKYRTRSYLKDAGETYYSDWKEFTPKKNEMIYSKGSVAGYRNLYGKNTFWEPTKVYYSGNAIKVSYRFYNTWSLVDGSCKVKVTFKSDGKVVGSKTISSGNISANSYKSSTITLKNKAGVDLRTIAYSVNYIDR